MGAVIAKNLQLFNLRKVQGWSQIETAAKLGIPVNLYAKIEQGKTPGKAEVWSRIQKLYDLPDSDMWSLIKSSM